LKEKSNARIKLACLLLQEQVDPEAILSRLTDAAELDPSNPDILFHRAQVSIFCLLSVSDGIFWDFSFFFELFLSVVLHAVQSIR
jgi:hypothetical protein